MSVWTPTWCSQAERVPSKRNHRCTWTIFSKTHSVMWSLPSFSSTTGRTPGAPPRFATLSRSTQINSPSSAVSKTSCPVSLCMSALWSTVSTCNWKATLSRKKQISLTLSTSFIKSRPIKGVSRMTCIYSEILVLRKFCDIECSTGVWAASRKSSIRNKNSFKNNMRLPKHSKSKKMLSKTRHVNNLKKPKPRSIKSNLTKNR